MVETFQSKRGTLVRDPPVFVSKIAIGSDGVTKSVSLFLDPMRDFKPEEILDLLDEVRQDIQICVRQATSTDDVNYGIPAQAQLVCRAVRGLIVPEKSFSIAAGQNVSVGGYLGYISAEDLQRSDIKPNLQLLWEGKTYQIEYRRGIQANQGEVLLHELGLRQTQSQTFATQPDPVINF
jgi:hypothetical protein